MKVSHARALRVLAMADEDRLAWAQQRSEDRDLFLKQIDDVAPALHARGWAEYADFNNEPGAVVVTTGHGDLRRVVITDSGREALRREMS